MQPLLLDPEQGTDGHDEHDQIHAEEDQDRKEEPQELGQLVCKINPMTLVNGGS